MSSLPQATPAKRKGTPAAAGPGDAPEPGPLRILVGFDGGQAGSDDALALAKALAEEAEVELIVASVRPYWQELLGEDGFAGALESDRRWIRRQTRQVVGDLPFSAVALAEEHGGTGLAELAASESVDLIALGSSRSARAGRVRLGTDAGRILDGAPCAVAVAPSGLAERPVSLQTIAVGYDGSRASEGALRRAVGLAKRTGASLAVLGVVEISIGVGGVDTRPPTKFEQERMQRHLRRALESIPNTVPARSRLLSGPAGEAIVDAAKDVDLLILGSRGHYGTSNRLLLGRVGAEVLEDAPCPTLIAPTG
jgi:nucleotide-binding universal stress UspA family protein